MTKMTRYLPKLLPLFLTLTLVLVGCAQPPAAPPTTPKPPTTPTQPPAAPSPPTLKITKPAAGATLQPGNIEVSVEVSNFELVAPGGASAPGKGHIHYYLDVDPPTTPGQVATTTAGTYKASPNTSVTWDNVAVGSHKLSVQLVNNDHTPLSPPVTAQVTVTVSAPAPTPPSVKFIKPAAGATLQAGSIEISVEVSNFEIIPPGGANAPGKGHIHYYRDVEIPTTAGKAATTAAGTYLARPSTSVTWDNVTAGSHTFGVQLVNNDHTPLSPPVTAQVTVTVAAAAAGPSIRIITPASGATLPTGAIQVTVEVSNFELVAPGSGNAPNKGHIHYYLDVDPPTTPGQAATTPQGTYQASPGTTVSWPNVTGGPHKLSVQLVNSDHTPLSPPVTAQISIIVAASAPGGGGY